MVIERLTLGPAVRRSAALLAISQATADALATHFPTTVARTVVAHLGAAPVHVGGLNAAEAAALPSPGFVLAVGTLEPRKNLPRLVEAYQRARRTLPEPWPLVVVGPQGWGPALARGLDHEGVILAGKVSDGVLAGLYRRARAFAYVPLTEGYGLPPLEAMRHGTPCVVARDVPSVHDLGQAGEPAAHTVDPFDIDDIADGLTRVLTDASLRADLSGRGKAYARARTWRGAAQAHVTLWRSLA